MFYTNMLKEGNHKVYIFLLFRAYKNVLYLYNAEYLLMKLS